MGLLPCASQSPIKFYEGLFDTIIIFSCNLSKPCTFPPRRGTSKTDGCSHEGLHIAGFFRALIEGSWVLCVLVQHCSAAFALPGLTSLGLPKLPTSDSQSYRELPWKPE